MDSSRDFPSIIVISFVIVSLGLVLVIDLERGPKIFPKIFPHLNTLLATTPFVPNYNSFDFFTSNSKARLILKNVQI
jgi:hypothetical protein